MINILILKGIPGSGKSTWAKSFIAENPLNYLRINNDDLRASFNNSIFSKDYEKIIESTRLFLIKEGIKHNKNIIIDNVNIGNNIFEQVVKIAKESNKDISIEEKCFYIDLEEAILRDSKREGKTKVGPDVIRHFWNKSGKESFKKYVTKCEIIKNSIKTKVNNDIALDKCIICDLDGTLALLNRNPYDAKDCDIKDLPNIPVVETVNLYYKNNYSIIFCSGREDKYESETKRFIEKYLPDIKYQLFMRITGDNRKDSIIKEEMFRSNIENKYYVTFIMDDRQSVVDMWRSLGLTVFQVAPGDF